MSDMAEQNVIGSLLVSSDSLSKVYGYLEPQMFTSELLGRIFLEFQRGYDNGYIVNPAVLLQKLGGDAFPEDIVSNALKDCAGSVFTSAHIVSYAKVIVNNYKACQVSNILGTIKIQPDIIDKQIGELITDLEAVRECKIAVSKALSDIAKENKDKYFKDRSEEKIYLGFDGLDNILGGLEGGDMIVIGARPAVGKSAFVTQITSNLADKGKRIGFYNLEMQEKQVYERFVVAHSGIGLTRLRHAVRFLGDEKERFDKANEMLEKQDNIIISTGSKTVSEIRNESRHMGYDVIVIDYLQLLKADRQYQGNRYAEVGAISKAIKGLAMELNIPIIALSQLNRASEMKETKEPTMAELREAGDIEQDASVVILMWNFSKEDRSKKGCKVEKNRQGQTGKKALVFNGDLMRFSESEEDIKTVKAWASAQEDDCPFE